MRTAAVRRPHPVDLLGAYALDACSPAEAATVAAHAAGCTTCADEIDHLIAAAQRVGTTNAAPPPAALRNRVLAAALAARPAAEPAAGDALDPYALQVAAFDELLRGLTDEEWYLPSGKYRTVHDLVDIVGGLGLSEDFRALVVFEFAQDYPRPRKLTKLPKSRRPASGMRIDVDKHGSLPV